MLEGPRRGRSLSPALGLVALLACGPKADPGDETGAGASTSNMTDAGATDAASSEPTTQGPVHELCHCLAEADGGYYVDTSLCLANSCGQIEMRCEGTEQDQHPFCVWGGTPVVDPDLVDCALDKLVHGTPGLLEYAETPETWEVYSGGFVEIGAARMGLAQTYAGEDLSGTESATEVVPLRDPGYFVACQALAEPLDRYQCLKDWTDGPAVATCAPGGNLLPF
jgi:hypothetical protein